MRIKFDEPIIGKDHVLEIGRNALRDPQIPNEVDEWLDGFNTFSIYQVLPQLIELWGLNVKTDVEAKKTSPN